MATNLDLTNPNSPDENLPPGKSSPHFGAADRALSEGFISNLKEFLTERPVKVHGNAPSAFSDEDFGDGFMANLKEYFSGGPRVARGAAPSRLSVDWQAWHRTLWQNLRDAISPPRLPPLKVTSQPVKVKDIWSKDKAFGPSQGISLAVHIALIVLLVVPLIHHVVSGSTPVVQATLYDTDISPYSAALPAAKDKAGGGGGGGDRNPIPASKGKLPKFSMTQLTPPMVVVKNLNPKMSATPTVLGPPDLKLPSPNLPNYGDPLAASMTDSNGPGSGAGIGSGSDGGVGSRTAFVANADSGTVTPINTATRRAARPIRVGADPRAIVITPDGRGIQIQVVKGLGLGLDEEAVEAVKGWRFKPAYGPDGKPVATITEIEVTFRLL